MNKKSIIIYPITTPANNEHMFAEVVNMIQESRQNVLRVANTALIDLYESG